MKVFNKTFYFEEGKCYMTVVMCREHSRTFELLIVIP